MPRALAIGLVGLGLVAALAWSAGRPGPARGAEAPDAVAILERLQPAAPLDALLRGEVTTFAVPEHGDREIAVGLALFVQAPPWDIAQAGPGNRSCA